MTTPSVTNKKREREEEKSQYQKVTESGRLQFRNQLKEAQESWQLVSKAEPLLIGKSDVPRQNRVSRALVMQLDGVWEDSDRVELLIHALQSDTGPFGVWFGEQFGSLVFGSRIRDPIWDECMPELFVLACEHMTLTTRVKGAIDDVHRAFTYVPEENSEGEAETSIDLSAPVERLIAVLGNDDYFKTKACKVCGRCGIQAHVKGCAKQEEEE